MKHLLLGSALLLTGCGLLPPLSTPTPTAEVASPSVTATPGEPAVILFDEIKQKSAHLQVERAALRPFRGEFQATGTLSYDKNLQVRVTSRLAGRAVQLLANLGDEVNAGQNLATLDAPELFKYKADYHQAETNLRLAQKAMARRRQLALYGEEIRRPLDDARNELATARGELEIARSNVDVNEAKARRVESLKQDGITSQAQVEQARADLRSAQATRRAAEEKVRIAESHLTREQRISRMGLLSSKEVQEAQADVERAEEEVEHLRAGLESLGASSGGHGSTVTIPAPISGTVISRPLTLGESVAAGQELYSLADTHTLWLWVNVQEELLARLRRGQGVVVEVPAFPRKSFSGKISYIAPELEEKTRTARALVVIDNRDERLKPAMYASVRVETGSRKSLVVPLAALQKVQDLDVVYVQSGPGEFQRRAVVVGKKNARSAEILEGLQAGETLATEGSFVIKAEDLKSQLQEGE